MAGLRHRKSSLVINIPPDEKILAPPKESKDRKDFSAVPPCLPLSRPLIPVPTHRLPHNADNASKILRPKPVPSALCGPFAAPLHAPLSAPGTLCGGDKQLYFRFVGLKYVMPIKHQMCAFVKHFLSPGKDKLVFVAALEVDNANQELKCQNHAVIPSQCAHWRGNPPVRGKTCR